MRFILTFICLTQLPLFSFQVDIDALLQRLTLEEKVGQLNQYSSTFDLTGPAPSDRRNVERLNQIKSGQVGSMLNVTGAEATRRAQELVMSNSRLKIPLIFAFDVIHGYQTMFPIPLGETASWNLQAIQSSARVAATEAAASGLHWTFAPMVDISRDARWGRVMEGAGEDPYLASLVAAARVRGFQGENLSKLDTVAACAKHFAGYGFAESGRDYHSADFSEHTLHNVILPPFKAAVDAGVASIMNSFNEWGGVPATSNTYLQRTILKGKWDFKGMVVSDWNSVGELIPHGVAENLSDAARLAILAGCDMDMEGRAFVLHLKELVESGFVEEEVVDEAVRRVLLLKQKMGLFEDPYRYSDLQREKEVVYNRKHQKLARDVARKSIVLLKNEGNLLPIKAETKSIAVIGPLAADKDTPLGSWRAKAIPNSAVSALEGIQAAAGDIAIHYSQGASLGVGEPSFVREVVLNNEDRSGFDEAKKIAEEAELVVMVMGEMAFQSGEGRSQVDIGLKGVQLELLKNVLDVNPNVIVVLMNGRPLDLSWLDGNVPAIVEAWHLGSQAGHAIADVLFGHYNPSGRLPVSFPRHVGQMPLYYYEKHTGRRDPDPNGMVFWSHYTDSEHSPLYPFGFGLSYTQFEYQNTKLSHSELERDGSIKVFLDIKNVGTRRGTETVQLYIRDLVGSLSRPILELKGFQQVTLEGGESQTVTFEITADKLAFYNASRSWVAEPGEFQVFVAPHAGAGEPLTFTLKP